MSFDKAIKVVIEVEGGYVNDPRDPGGETKYGITKTTLERAIREGLVPADTTVENLTTDQGKIIYRAFYWEPAQCDVLPWPLCLFVCDAAVNQGVETAKKLLQKSLGVAQDGVIGKNTLTAIVRANQKELCALFMADRALRYQGTRNADIYGRGWLKRLFVIAMEA